MPGVWRRRSLVILGILAGLVGVYAAVGFLLVPRVLRSELVKITARDFGRKLSIGDVDFNPFTWRLDIRDFSLPDADGRPMVSFARLQVEVAVVDSLAHFAPDLREIVLDAPRVNAVVRPGGKLNLAELTRPAPAKPQATSSGPFKLFVDRLAVTNGSATYEDESRPTPFRLDLNPIGFELLDFSTAGTTPGTYHLTAAIAQGGRLDGTGTIRTQPVSLHGTLKLDGLSAPTVATYLGPILPAEISRGTFGLQGSFAVDSAPAGAIPRPASVTIDLSRVQVSGLGVRPRQAASDYVQLDRLTLGNTHIDLGQRSVTVGEIALAGANVRGWLDPDGKLNLLQLLGPAAGKSSSAASVPTARPRPAPAPAAAGHAAAWRIAAPDIRIEDTRLSLEDRTVKPAADLTLGPMTARITGYDSSPQSHLAVTLQSAVNGKGQLHLGAQLTLRPMTLSAKLAVSHIDLRALQPYLNKYTGLTLDSGFLSSSLAIERAANGRLSTAGRIDVDNLRTVDDDLKKDFLKWQELHIVGFRYVLGPASLHIARIVAVKPYARVIIGADHTVNLTEALHPRGARAKAVPVKDTGAKAAPAEAAPTKTAAAGGKSMPMAIGLVRIAGGTADYADFTLQPNFATGIQDLHGTITGLSSDPGSRADVDLKGKVDRYAPVDISGVVNLLAATTYTDVTMKFRGLELTHMTPYAVRFAGYKIASGTLDADLHYKVDHGRLDAEHRFVIDQLQLGDRVDNPKAIKLPLRLAIALLKDRDGVIRIGLPVTGSLNDPKFSVGPLIRIALIHLLEKVVTAPFAMLGHLFGGGQDMGHVDFLPGSATLLPAAQAQLAALAKALAQRPQLQLQVPVTFAPDLDRPALAKRQLRHELIALANSGAGDRAGHGKAHRAASAPAGKEVLELPGEHYRLLRAAYQSAFGRKALPAEAKKVPPYEPAIDAMQSALLARASISDADLQGLGQQRAQAIRTALLSAGVAAGRVGIGAAAAKSVKADKVTVALGLK